VTRKDTAHSRAQTSRNICNSDDLADTSPKSHKKITSNSLRRKVGIVATTEDPNNGPHRTPCRPTLSCKKPNESMQLESQTTSCMRTPRLKDSWTIHSRCILEHRSRSPCKRKTSTVHTRTATIPHPLEPGCMLHEYTKSRKELQQQYPRLHKWPTDLGLLETMMEFD